MERHRLILQQAPFFNRSEFGNYLNSQRLLGQAVEIGTHRGEFARQLLHQWNGQFLHCIDPYIHDYDLEDLICHNATPESRQADKEEAKQILMPFEGRYKLHERTSIDASFMFEEKCMDFIYIDGCHQYKSVMNDLSSWWPKVVDGGIIGGHDFLCPGEANGGWGCSIQTAVLKFAAYMRRTVWMVQEKDNSPWSFYLVK